MHIPDGFLDTKTVIVTTLLSGGAGFTALRRLQKNLQPSQIPLLGLSASFIFVAQMLNFPVIGGTSGHLVGAVLAAVLLGPDAAIVCMMAVLLIQAFIFADGGIVALGANILNMGVAAALCGYTAFRFITWFMPSPRGKIVASIFSAWFSIVCASAFCAGELAWSGTSVWSMVFPAMVNVHILIGIGEGLITGLVIAVIYKTKPVMLEMSLRKSMPELGHSGILYGIIFLIGFLLLVTPFVTEWPDGLESVAVSLGFDMHKQATGIINSPLPDYTVPGISGNSTATIITGLIGAVCVFIIALVVGKMLLPKSQKQTIE